MLASTVGLSTPAFADICQDAPAPIAPKAGLPGLLTTPPKNIPDAAPDPFTDNKVSIGEVYGYNWKWANYDLGCGNDFLRDPVAVSNTQTANFFLSLSGGVLASGAAVEQMAKGSSIDWLSGVVTTAASVLRDVGLQLWFPLALVALGVLVAFQAKKASYADTATTLLVVVGAIALAVFAFVYPTKASEAVDHGVVFVADAAGSQFPTSATDAIGRESAYRTWLAGNFGDPDSQTARELGPRLLSATRYSWSDEKRITADPAAKDSIDKAKAAEFKKVAGELERRDPAAYEVFTGRGERTGPAFLGLIVVVAMSLFVFVASVMVLVARVMMQALAIAAPLAAIVGMFPGRRGVLAKMWDLFTAALVAVAKFVLAGGVMTLVLAGIQSASIGAGAKLFWVIVTTVVALVLTKPTRSIKTVLPGVDPNKSYLKDAASKVASYYGPALAANSIEEAGKQPKPTPEVPAEPQLPPISVASLPPLPKPEWATAGDRRPKGAAAASPSSPWEFWEGRFNEPTPEPRAAGPDFAPTPAVQPGPVRHALPAAPLALGAAPVAGEQQASAPAPRVDVAPAPPADGTPANPLTATGYVLPPDEPGIYRSDDSDLPVGTYVPAGDLELAEDGTEHERVTYHAASDQQG